MNKPRRESFLHGAAALAAAGIVVKIIGAFYKIPLGAMLGPVGMANFSIAYNIYSLLFVIATAGVPIAVSKMIAESLAAKNAADTELIYKVSGRLFSVLGFLGFLVLLFFAVPISELMGSRDAAFAIRAISPSVFFVSLSAVNRGYFQGHSDMYPTAVSEVMEALGKLICGIAAAWILKSRGADSAHIAAGAVSGVAIGAMASCVYFRFKKKKEKATRRSGAGRIIKKLLSISVPITLGAAVISLTAVIDSAIVMNILKKSGFTEYQAKWSFGAYNYATTLFSLPSAISATLASALVPAIAVQRAKRHTLEADKLINSGVRLAVLVASFAAFGMAALSKGIITLLYGHGIDEECIRLSSRLLQYLSIGIIPLAVVTITNSVHQAMGRASVPVVAIACGGLAKILSNYLLISIPEINIFGAAISTVLCYLTAMTVNVAQFKKYSYVEIDFKNSILKPIISGAVVFISAAFVYNKCISAFDVNASTVLAIFSGAVVGVISAFLMKNVTKYDKKLLFGSKNIFKFIEND